MKRILLIPFLLALLNACTTLPPSAPPSTESWQERQQRLSQIVRWHIKGQVGVRSQQDAVSATIDWVQNKQSYNISLLGPLGSYHMRLSGKPGKALLVAPDGKHFQGNNPESLLKKEWGFNLPISSLSYWIRTLPAPNQSFQRTFDAYHRIKTLKQAQWLVEYMRYTRIAGRDLPTLIRISSPQLTAKIAVSQWVV